MIFLIRWIVDGKDEVVPVTQAEFEGFQRSMEALRDAWNRSMQDSRSARYWAGIGG